MSDYNKHIARIITQRHPAAWDAIIPHGPAWAGVAGPVPDPWRYAAGPLPDPWQFVLGPGPQPWINGPHPDPWRSSMGPSPQPWINAGPQPDPWRGLSRVALNPQPLPPHELVAIAITDAMLTQVVGLANAADLFGGESTRNVQARAQTMLSEWDELCPRWPKWPKTWPPPPDPPGWLGDEMSPVAHFLAAARVLAASEQVADGSIASALAEIGGKQFEQSLSRMG